MSTSTINEFWRRWTQRNIQYYTLPGHSVSREQSPMKPGTLLNVLYGLLRKRLFQFIVATLFVTFTLLAVANQDRITLDSSALLHSSISESEPRYLHLLIPSNHKHPDLAKNLLSAAINGLPVPTIINWQVDYDNPKLIDGGSHLGKITGLLDWMNQQGRERDNDLVLIVDGDDIWFQLPASVLIKRYWKVIRQARKRIQTEIGSKAMRAEDIGQHIVISAQKSCRPLGRHSPACWAVPESPLPHDIYGKYTDQRVNQVPANGKFRSRYLNSGVMMGDLKHMRLLFERVKVKMAEDPKSGSDQRAFAVVFGEQEYRRAEAREDHRGRWQEIEKWFGWGSKTSTLEPPPKFEKPVLRDGVNYEFGITLDYEAQLGHAMHNGERDGAWITFNSTRSIQIARNKLKLSAKNEVSLPSDLEVLDQKPSLNDGSRESYLGQTTWNDASLYTDLYTSVVPAMIHMNGFENKHLTRDAWDRNWFQPHARSLLNSYVESDGDGPIAMSVEGGRNIEWFGVEKDRSVIRTFGRNGDGTVGWKEMLDGYEDEIFRDGGGKWEMPT